MLHNFVKLILSVFLVFITFFTKKIPSLPLRGVFPNVEMIKPPIKFLILRFTLKSLPQLMEYFVFI